METLGCNWLWKELSAKTRMTRQRSLGAESLFLIPLYFEYTILISKNFYNLLLYLTATTTQ